MYAYWFFQVKACMILVAGISLLSSKHWTLPLLWSYHTTGHMIQSKFRAEIFHTRQLTLLESCLEQCHMQFDIRVIDSSN